MKNNDIIRSVDTVLSGLTVSESRKAALVRRAMGTHHPAAKADHRGRFSLSFPMPHMIVAAIVVVIVIIAPLFVPEQTEFFDDWQYGDGEFYMVDGVRKEQNSQVAEADNRPGELGPVCGGGEAVLRRGSAGAAVDSGPVFRGHIQCDRHGGSPQLHGRVQQRRGPDHL